MVTSTDVNKIFEPMEIESQEFLTQKIKKNKECLTLGGFKIIPYWKDKDDDKEGEEVEYENLGMKQHVAMATGVIGISILSALFKKQPFISFALATGNIDLVKTWHSNLNSNGIKKAALIGSIALCALSLLVQYATPQEFKDSYAVQIAEALPLAYPLMGVMKSEINDLKLHKKIMQCFSSLSKIQAKTLSATLQTLPAITLLTVDINPFISAACGVFIKANLRKIMNSLGKSIVQIENPRLRKIAIGCFIPAVASSASVGFFINNIFTQIPTIVGTDTIARTFKAKIKAELKVEKKAKKAAKKAAERGEEMPPAGMCEKIKTKCKKIAKASLIAFPLIGSTFMTNDTALMNQNSGVISAVLGEVVSVAKIATKAIPVKAVLSTSLVAITGGVIAYTFKEIVPSSEEESPSIPLYGNILALTVLGAGIMSYQLKRLVRPVQIEKEPEIQGV